MAGIDDTRRLYERACKGDQAAFAQVADEQYRTVYGIAFSTIGNWSGAEDIAQETFLLAWSHKGSLRNAVAFPAWLRRIADNVSKNWMRSSGYRRRLADHYASQTSPESGPEKSLDVQADRQARKTEVWRALESLSPRLREAIVLYYLYGESLRSVSAALGISENAAKKRLHNGRAKLRAHFEDQWKQEMAQARSAMGTQSARDRFLAALVLGPAVPELGKSAASAGLGLWWEVTKQTALAQKALVGVGVMTGKQAMVAGAAALLVAGGAYWAISARVAETGEIDAETATSQPKQTIAPAADNRLLTSLPSIAPTPPDPSQAQSPKADPKGKDTQIDLITLRGVVVNSSDTPVTGAEVSLIRLGIGAPPQAADARLQQASKEAYEQGLRNRGLLWKGVTDYRGAFVIEDVRVSGATLLAARASGYGAAKQYLYAEVLNASRDNLKIRLQPSVTVHGILLGATGPPVSDGQIVLDGFVTELGNTGDSEGFATFTDKSGHFVLDIKVPGYLTLRVDSEEFGEATFPSTWASPDEELVLRYPAETSVFGIVKSADGSPVFDVEVRLEGTTVTSIPDKSGAVLNAQGKSFSALTDSSGSYSIVNLDSGQLYSAEVLGKDGVSLAYNPRVDDLTPGAKHEVNFIVQAPMIVRGTIYSNQSGKSLEGITVIAFLETAFSPTNQDSGTMRSAPSVSGSDGVFMVTIIGDGGAYALMTSYNRSGGGWGGAGPPEHVTVNLRPGDTVTQDLHADESATRSFLLVDDGGAPIPHAVTSIMINTESGGSGHGLEEKTGPDGRITVATIPPYGSSQINFSKEGYFGATSRRAAAEPGAVYPEETVVMYRPASLKVTVMDDKGMPIENQAVLVDAYIDLDNGASTTATTDEFGAALIEGKLPATHVSLTFRIDIKVSDNTVKVRAEMPDIDLSPGKNDLGEIVLSPE